MPSDDAAILEALAAFGVPEASIIRSLDASLTGNQNWVVADGGRKLVLRRCVRNASVERIDWQSRAQAHLRARRLPVPALWEDSSGALAVESGGHPWTLQAFVEGEHYDYARVEQAEEAGGRLAQFHVALGGFEAEGSNHPLEIGFARYWRESVAEIAALKARFGNALLEPSMRMLLEDYEAWFAAFCREWPAARADALPSGWNHCDYHGRNLIFEGDRLVALLDFDMVERAPYVLDIADGLVRFSREGRGSYVLRPEVGRRFLAGYEAVRALLEDERAAIPAFASLHDARPDHFFDHHPYDREHPLEALQGHLTSHHRVAVLRPVLEEIVAEG